MSVNLKKEKTEDLTNSKSDQLLDISSLNISKDITSLEVLNFFLAHLQKHHKLNNDDLKELLSDNLLSDHQKSEFKGKILVPMSIFNMDLGALETVVKFLTENLGLKNRKIGELLNRNARTIWTTYNNSFKKLPGKFIPDENEKFFVPISRFSDRLFSTLEVIVKYLRENYKLSLHDIAVILKRDDSTIWTVYHRVQKKEKSNPEMKTNKLEPKTAAKKIKDSD